MPEGKKPQAAVPEDRFRVLIENSYDVLILFSGEGTVEYVSPSVKRVLGYEPEELIGSTGPHLVHPDDMPMANDAFTRAIAEPGAVVRFVHRLRHKDGSYRKVEGTGTNLLHDPRVRAMLSHLRDITEQEASAAALRESEERFRLVFTEGPIGMHLGSPDLSFMRVNRAFSQMLGYQESELEGQPIFDFVHPEEREDGLLLARKAIAGEKVPKQTIYRRYLHRDTSSIWTRVHFRVIYDNDGSPLYCISIVENISEQRSLERQLQQAQKMEAIGNLAGGVAHDFNNLLTVISGNIEIGKQKLSHRENNLEELDNIRHATTQAAKLTSQLLAFGRRQLLQPRRIELNSVIESVIQILGRTIPENIRIESRLGDGVPALRADPVQMQQLLMNLALNARDAMQNGGVLSIATRRITPDSQFREKAALEGIQVKENTPYAEIAIADTGEGMDESTLGQIFEPFFTTKGVLHGTGLGLAVVYGIVRQHDALIYVDSTPGAGSTFRVYFPEDSQPEEQLPLEVKITPVRPGRGSVLVTEDNAAVRNAARRMLEQLGYSVLTAEDGEQALSLFEEQQETIVLALLDVVMPGMSGPELYEELLARQPGLPVVFMTGYDVNSRLAELDLDAAQVVRVLPKPYTLEELAEAVQSLVDPGTYHSS